MNNAFIQGNNVLSAEEEKILSLLDEEEITEFLRKLVRTDSQNPPGKEKEVAFMIKEKLDEIGMETQLQEVEKDRFNVIGLLPGKSPEAILFNGHTDTVKIGSPENWTCDPLGGEIKDGKLYGRGACDMKGGLASMIYALKALAESGIEREKSVLFTGVIDEEVFFKGTRRLMETGVLANCTRCYIAEPTDCMIASSLQGAAEFTAVTFGKSSHTGMAEKGVNAIIPMADFAMRLKILGDRLKNEYTDAGHQIFPTINVGVIDGGTDILLVPDRCEMSFDRQVFPEEEMDAAIEEIKALFHQTCNDHGIKGEIKCNQFFYSWKADEGHPALTAIKDAHGKTAGEKPQECIFRGYAEIEMLHRYGIPGALYGPGSIMQAHRPDEFVELDQVMQAAATYALTALDFVHKRKQGGNL